MKLTVKHSGFDKNHLEINTEIDNENNSITIEINNSKNDKVNLNIDKDNTHNDRTASNIYKKNSEVVKLPKVDLYEIRDKLFNFIVSHCTAGAVFLFSALYLKKEYDISIKNKKIIFENYPDIIGFYLITLMTIGGIGIYCYLVYKLHIDNLNKNKEFKDSKLFLIYGLSFWGIF